MLNIINKRFGEIVLGQVFEYYDYPVLFSCEVDGLVYLAVLADDGISVADWIFVQVSPERFDKIRAGEISLYDAFKDAETSVVYAVRVDTITDEVFGVTERVCSQLSDEELPLKTAFLP